MITNDTKLKVIQLKQSGMTYSQISEQLGISKGSISAIVKEAGLGVSKPVDSKSSVPCSNRGGRASD